MNPVIPLLALSEWRDDDGPFEYELRQPIELRALPSATPDRVEVTPQNLAVDTDKGVLTMRLARVISKTEGQGQAPLVHLCGECPHTRQLLIWKTLACRIIPR